MAKVEAGVNLKARVTQEFKTQLDRALFERGMSLQSAIVNGLKLILKESGDSIAEGGPFGELTPKQRKVLAGVLRILADQSKMGRSHAKTIELLVELHPES